MFATQFSSVICDLPVMRRDIVGQELRTNGFDDEQMKIQSSSSKFLLINFLYL